MDVCVVIPYAPSTDRRTLLFEFTRSYLEKLGYEIVLGTADNLGGPVSFNHPKAINDAVSKTSAEMLMIVDADTLPAGGWLDAIDQVRDLEWAWSMPRTYLKLSEGATEQILDGSRLIEEMSPADAEWSGTTSWAGVQICRRESFLAVGGWDERFINWGSDDACFGLAMDTVVGRHTRFDGYAVHLWHPQGPSDSYLHDNWGPQYSLTERYKKAYGSERAMQDIFDERTQKFR